MYSQRHADRQDIHTVGGVVGDLGDGLADDGGKVRIIGIEAQIGTVPDVGHMMQAVLTAIGGGQNYAPAGGCSVCHVPDGSGTGKYQNCSKCICN